MKKLQSQFSLKNEMKKNTLTSGINKLYNVYAMSPLISDMFAY